MYKFISASKTKSDLPAVTIIFDDDSISLVQLGQKIEDKQPIVLCEQIKTTPSNREHDLAKLVKKYSLELTDAVLVLLPKQYEIFILDASDVNPSGADNFVVKQIEDLSTYPIEDAIYDYIYLEVSNNEKKLKKILVTIAHKEEILQYAHNINNSLLNLSKISITDISLRNIANYVAKEEKGTSLIIFFYHNVHKMLICKDGAILLVRNMANMKTNKQESNLFAETEEEKIQKEQESVASSAIESIENLDQTPDDHDIPIEFIIDNLKNSFSYCSSILKISEPKSIILMASSIYKTSFTQNIQKYLEKEVKNIDITEIVNTTFEIPPHIVEYALIGIGGLIENE